MATLANAPGHDGLRVLVLSKRQYMARDLLDDRYGRFRELPLALAHLGASVRGLCLSYRARAEGAVLDGDQHGAVAWSALNLARLLPFGERSYWRELDRIGGQLRPNVVWACSDVPHARLGVAAARRLGARLVVDLYDNFEGYPLARLPGINRSLRASVAAADGVTCVSAPLAEYVRDRYGYRGALEVIENAIPPGLFVAADKACCRAELGLPLDAILIGTAGALSPGRGTQFLVEAFWRLAERRHDVHLVLAGPLDPGLSLPSSERVHVLGSLPPTAVPRVLAALDLSVVCNRDTAFSRFCFPQKLYESLACGVPVVVAGVGAMDLLLADYPQNLYPPDDVDGLLATIERQLREPVLPSLAIPTWPALASRLQAFLADCARR